MDELFSIVNQLSNRLGTNEHNIYPISFGSPIDEYFFDDLDKLLLEYKYSKEQLNEYTEKYVEIAQQAKYHSYTRADIVHSYPLDYYFCSGKVALKIATLYELLQIKENTSLGTYNTNTLSYSILPVPYANEKERYNNSKTTLNRFIKNSEYHWEFVNSQRVALMNFIENNILEEELFCEIKFIMEKWYDKQE